MLLADSDAVLGAGFAMLAAATLPFIMTGGPSRSSATMLASFSAAADCCCRSASRLRLAGVRTCTAPAVVNALLRALQCVSQLLHCTKKPVRCMLCDLIAQASMFTGWLETLPAFANVHLSMHR